MLRVALVGCGAVVWNYYKDALQKLETENLLKVQILLDPSPLALGKLGKIFPLASSARDVSEISKAKADLAIVASPPSFHASQSVALLGSGVAVLCEKPMALTVAEAEAMVSAPQKGALLFVSHPRRFLEPARKIKNSLSKGSLGNVTSFSFTEGVRFSWPAESDAFFKKASGGGGVFMDLGPHVLDLLFWWLGEPSEIVYEDDAMGGVEANAILRVRFKEGFKGSIILSRELDLSNRYEIRCERGVLTLDLSSMDIARLIENQLRSVVSAVNGRENNCVSGHEALKTVRWIEHCYKTARLISMPWLDPEESTAAVKMRK